MSDRMNNLLAQLGTGRWHVFHMLAVSYSVIFPTPHALGSAFLAPRQDYYCDVSSEEDLPDHYFNETKEFSCYYPVRLEDGSFREEKCSRWIFDNSTFTNTVTSEFDLVCEKEYLRATYQSMYMLGTVLGSPLNGFAADKYGRKTIFIFGASLFSIFAIASCWVTNISLLLASRFLLGAMHPALLKTGYILVIESAEPKVRSVLGVAFYLPWTIATFIWAGLAYYIRSWRWLQLCISLPCLVILPALWFLDESPRWLSVVGEYEKALQVIKRIGRWNRICLPSDDEILSILKGTQELPTVEEKTEKRRGVGTIIMDHIKSAFILYRTRRLLLISVVMHLDFFVFGMVFFGLALGGSNFTSNAFLYMALMGLMEVPGCTINGSLIGIYGRKLPISFNLLLTGVLLLILPFVPTDSGWVVVTFALVGKMTINMSFQAGKLYMSELFPTEVRSRGLSITFMWSRVGSAISPFITEYLSLAYPWAPSVIFGVAALIAGLATLSLWETLDIDLPDTINQLESKAFVIPKRQLSMRRIAKKKDLSISEAANEEEKARLKSSA